MQGWRYAHAGQVIEDFLNGHSTLQTVSGELKKIRVRKNK